VKQLREERSYLAKKIIVLLFVVIGELGSVDTGASSHANRFLVLKFDRTTG